MNLVKEIGTDLLYVTSITMTIEVTPLSFKDDTRVEMAENALLLIEISLLTATSYDNTKRSCK